MMRIQFETVSSAFRDEGDEDRGDEIDTILQTIGNHVRGGLTQGTVRDTNGNAIGDWELTRDD